MLYLECDIEKILEHDSIRNFIPCGETVRL